MDFRWTNLGQLLQKCDQRPERRGLRRGDPGSGQWRNSDVAAVIVKRRPRRRPLPPPAGGAQVRLLKTEIFSRKHAFFRPKTRFLNFVEWPQNQICSYLRHSDKNWKQVFKSFKKLETASTTAAPHDINMRESWVYKPTDFDYATGSGPGGPYFYQCVLRLAVTILTYFFTSG